VVVPLAMVATARVVAWDAHSVLVALNALTPFLYLPAWPVAVAAGLARRWAMFATALVVVAAHVAFVAPELAARTPLPAVAQDIRAVRLFSANVYARNTQAGGIAQEIIDSRPDVVFLQEATPAIVETIDAAGALAEMPHRIAVRRGDRSAGLLAARWPLLDQDVVEVDGRPMLLRATVHTEGGPLRLYAVHVAAPLGTRWKAASRELRRITELARAERLPVLMAGDFNTTWGHRAFRRLLDAGFTDAAAAGGRPFQMTWPRDRRLIPPFTRIDHVLTTPGLAVVALHPGEGQGSDHRPLIADVARTIPPG
jgi:endonuclease/exonuclease/phosphatase (EEP) superfamily protein YafD